MSRKQLLALLAAAGGAAIVGISTPAYAFDDVDLTGIGTTAPSAQSVENRDSLAAVEFSASDADLTGQSLAVEDVFDPWVGIAAASYPEWRDGSDHGSESSGG